MSLAPLPIDPYIPDIVARVRERRALVITASPGAGKTTRVPPALAPDGPVIVLQPRRVAARSIARRIAVEQNWTVGDEVGWHVRFERQFLPSTRVLLATEGILTARLQQDPLLSAFRTIVVDEFHERSIHADVGLALAKQAWLARDDLRIVVMSATMETAAVSAYLRGCDVVDVPGRVYPLTVAYRPGMAVARAVHEIAAATSGHVLCFLPGAPEIRRAAADIQATVGSALEMVPLHGSLDAAAQDRAMAPSATRRVILATNIAETSLTVPGVDAVVDTGVHKVARYDPDRAIDSLEAERITQDSADQRAGRAARLGPGVAWRLWPEADRLRPRREPDIHRIDLSGPLLDILAWGGTLDTFDWFDPPASDAVASGLALLTRLGAIESDRVTPLGRLMHRLPIHPRLARILIAAGGAYRAALACALLSERHFLAPRAAATDSDLLSAIEHERDLPPHVVRVAHALAAAYAGGPDPQSRVAVPDEAAFRQALLYGYPDRVAKRRSTGSARVLLASGHGAAVGSESGVHGGEYLLALDVQAGRRGEIVEARIRLASVVSRAWLVPTATRVEHELDATSGLVRAFARDYYDEILLSERIVPVEVSVAAGLLARAYLERGLDAADEQIVRRLRFAGVDLDARALVEQASAGCRSLSEIDIGRDLAWQVRKDLEHLAPERLSVPSGRSHPLEYRPDGTVTASVKLQELFGLRDTPTIGRAQVPVLLILLAPNGRPVQTTRDLASFWDRTYPEVRKELRGRYPRHPWPENPWTAIPTARTTPRKR